jgi:hypothetical protein
MTDDEWMKALRSRTHDLSNKMQGWSEELIVLRAQQVELRRRLEDVEGLEVVVLKLEHQAQVLRWILGVVTALVVTLASNALYR